MPAGENQNSEEQGLDNQEPVPAGPASPLPPPSIPGRAVQSVLFACGQNVVRSPMAEALARRLLGERVFVSSAGVRPGEPDPFVGSVLGEIGLAANAHGPQGLEDLDDLEAFDLIITLAPEAHHRALALTRVFAAEVEYWPTLDPTVVAGAREQQLAAYRQVRDALAERIRTRFGVV